MACGLRTIRSCEISRIKMIRSACEVHSRFCRANLDLKGHSGAVHTRIIQGLSYHEVYTFFEMPA